MNESITPIAAHYNPDESITPIAAHYNMDTACVEVLLSDASTISINTHTIESLYAHTKNHRADLDYLIYNHPLEYATLALSDNFPSYLHGTSEHSCFD